MKKTKKPYIDYEDDETVLPLMGTRKCSISKRTADYVQRWKMKSTNMAMISGTTIPMEKVKSGLKKLVNYEAQM